MIAWCASNYYTSYVNEEDMCRTPFSYVIDAYEWYCYTTIHEKLSSREKYTICKDLDCKQERDNMFICWCS